MVFNLNLSNYFFILFYFFSLFLFLSFNSLFYFWLFLEINMFAYILLILFSDLFFNSGFNFNQCLFYFIIQSIGSMLFLLCFLLTQELYLDFFLVLSIFFKLGLSPFHFWFYKLIYFLPLVGVVFLLTFQKLPLFFLLSEFSNLFFWSGLILNLVVGGFFLYFSNRVMELLASSSIYITFWLLLFYLINFSFFFFFILIYFFYIFLFLRGVFFSHKLIKKNVVSSIVFLMGLPPFLLFFFKFYGVLFVRTELNFLFWVLWIFTFLPVVCYFKFFLSYFEDFKLLYLSDKSSVVRSNLKNFFFIRIFFFLFF